MKAKTKKKKPTPKMLLKKEALRVTFLYEQIQYGSINYPAWVRSTS